MQLEKHNATIRNTEGKRRDGQEDAIWKIRTNRMGGGIKAGGFVLHLAREIWNWGSKLHRRWEWWQVAVAACVRQLWGGLKAKAGMFSATLRTAGGGVNLLEFPKPSWAMCCKTKQQKRAHLLKHQIITYINSKRCLSLSGKKLHSTDLH